jgi:uncharacterized protein GlcG (DUF336 family)
MKRGVSSLVAAICLGVLCPHALAASCHPVAAAPQSLSAADVEGLVAGTATVAGLNRKATIAVVDRVGNVLAVYRSGTGNSGFSVRIRSGLLDPNSVASRGLEGLSVGDDVAAISKAVTGAYLSSSGNAFSTRTASFIVQKNFIPTLRNFPSGPLFGVQFSQLPCGDLVQKGAAAGIGPRQSPLGLSADPGGFPLYKGGRVVGGIGVVVEGSDYSLDLNPIDRDNDIEEVIAQAGSLNFAAPRCIRGDNITAGGFNLRYSDSDAKLPKRPIAQAFAGGYVAVSGFIDVAAPRAGRAYGEASSGYQLQATGDFVTRRGMVLVDASGNNRFTPRDSSAPAVGAGGMARAEVTTILQQALGVANQARAQIRRPLNSPAEVTISVVDRDGNLLGLVRTPDAPVFGTDVSLQKARTAAFFSRSDAAQRLVSLGQSAYAADALRFFGAGALSDGVAITARSVGNIARPNFPDGIDGKPNGPFSKPVEQWSPFNVGLQLDLVLSGLAEALGLISSRGGEPNACTTSSAGAAVNAGINNGIQIFPGAVPVYRDGQVIGAVGISGDGVDQDDMIAALGLERARRELATQGSANPLGHAPREIRSDRLPVPGPGSLRYVQCPQSPFVSSQVQNVCNF